MDSRSDEARARARARVQQRQQRSASSASARQMRSASGTSTPSARNAAPLPRSDRSARPVATRQPVQRAGVPRNRVPGPSGQARPQYRNAVSRPYQPMAPAKRPFPLVPVAAAVILLVVVAFVVSGLLRGCSGDAGKKQVVEAQQAMTVADSPEPPAPPKPVFDPSQVDRGIFDELIGTSRTDSLLKLAETNEDAAWILLNPGAYDEIGPTAHYRLLKLCTDDNNALPFVRNCPEKWKSDPTGGCDPVKPGTVPLLLQWDQRWGFAGYSLFVMGLSACGPTSICMVYQGLTGDSSLSPYDIAQDAIDHDYVHGGTDEGFYFWEADHLGMSCEHIGVSSSSLREALQDGCLVIINVGPGDFTEVGHFIVATGVEGDDLIINDPFSTVRSAKRWNIDQVIGQTMALYCFSK